jgi:hypothetical protein
VAVPGVPVTPASVSPGANANSGLVNNRSVPRGVSTARTDPEDKEVATVIGSVASGFGSNQGFWDDPELTFYPPFFTELFKDSRFRVIRWVVINLPSGIENSSDMRYYIPAADKSQLKIHVIMTPLMSNARMIHRDIVGKGSNRAQQNEHARVVNYKGKLDSHRPSTGGRPWWTATLQLPEQLSSTAFLRNQLLTDKEGNCKLLCLDLLVQESIGGPSSKPVFESLDSDTDTDKDDIF